MSRAKKPANRAAATPPRGTVWVVTDATPDSTLGDICFQADAAGLIRQVRGGLSEDQHPVLHAEHEAAEADACARILAARAREAIAGAASPGTLREATRIEVRAADGRLLFGAEIGGTQ